MRWQTVCSKNESKIQPLKSRASKDSGWPSKVRNSCNQFKERKTNKQTPKKVYFPLQDRTSAETIPDVHKCLEVKLFSM